MQKSCCQHEQNQELMKFLTWNTTKIFPSELATQEETIRMWNFDWYKFTRNHRLIMNKFGLKQIHRQKWMLKLPCGDIIVLRPMEALKRNFEDNDKAEKLKDIRKQIEELKKEEQKIIRK